MVSGIYFFIPNVVVALFPPRIWTFGLVFLSHMIQVLCFLLADEQTPSITKKAHVSTDEREP